MSDLFSEGSPGHLTRVERDGTEVKIVFSAGTEDEAEDLAQFIVLNLRKGRLNFHVIEPHATVM